MVRKETYMPPSAVARVKDSTTSSAVTAEPSENLAPSRSATSKVVSSICLGSEAARPETTE